MSARRHHPTRGYSALPAIAKCARFKNSGESSAAGERGTRIHATVEWALGHEAKDAFTTEDLEAEPELKEEVEWILFTLHNLYPESPATLDVETEIPLRDASFQEVTFGTYDYYAGGHLSDLKTGRKKDYRPQMAGLSLALMDREGIESMKVSLIWSQTREVETWSWTREEVENIVWRILESQDRQDPANPNENCIYCKDGETCPARVNAAYTLPVTLTTSENITAYAEKLTPDERGAFLRKLKVAKKWCEEAEEAMESWALGSPETNAITGYKVGLTKPKRVWANEGEAMVAIKAKAKEMGRSADNLVEIKMAGVTKVHEILGRSKAVVAMVDGLLVQPKGVPALLEDWSASKPKAVA